MSIKSYVPPKKNIIDHRTTEGGYYNAICDVCGTEFFPKRSNAKYCSSNCGIVAHRTAIANGDVVKKRLKTVPEDKNSSITARGSKAVYEQLSKIYDTSRQKGVITGMCKELQVGSYFDFKSIRIRRISSGLYKLSSTK